jgi:hypothetical protein
MADWVSDFTSTLAAHLETPDEMLKAVGLFTAGAALAGRVVMYSPEELSTNLYLLLSGPPGKVKKTTAIKQGLKILNRILPKEEFTDQNSSIEALIKSISTTAEQRGIRHGVLFYDEFSGLMHQTKREHSSGIMTMLLERWQAGAVPYTASRRKDSGVDRDSVPSDYIFSLASSTTPDGLVKAMSSDDVTNGFASRVMLIEARTRTRRFAHSRRVSEDWIAYMGNRLAIAREIFEQKTEFTLSDGAIERITTIYDDFDRMASRHPNEEFHKVVGRMDGYVKKLALLEAALSHPGFPVIDAEDVDEVIPIVMKSMNSWEKTLDDVSGSGNAWARLLSRIKAVLRRLGSATPAELARATSARSGDLGEAIETLVLQGCAEIGKDEDTGQKTVVWKEPADLTTTA